MWYIYYYLFKEIKTLIVLFLNTTEASTLTFNGFRERSSISLCSDWPIWANRLKHELHRALTHYPTTFLLWQKHRYSTQNVKLYDWNIQLVANRSLSCDRVASKWQFNKTLGYVARVHVQSNNGPMTIIIKNIYHLSIVNSWKVLFYHPWRRFRIWRVNVKAGLLLRLFSFMEPLRF